MSNTFSIYSSVKFDDLRIFEAQNNLKRGLNTKNIIYESQIFIKILIYQQLDHADSMYVFQNHTILFFLLFVSLLKNSPN